MPAGRPTPRRCAAAMESLKVDTKGLRGGPIEWTKDNHFRTQQYYRVYRWDGGKIARGEGLDDLRREIASAVPCSPRLQRAGAVDARPTREPLRATRRQHRRAGVDLRADRLRLCADLSRQPRAQSRAWRTDDARRLSAADDGSLFSGHPFIAIACRHRAQPPSASSSTCF